MQSLSASERIASIEICSFRDNIGPTFERAMCWTRMSLDSKVLCLVRIVRIPLYLFLFLNALALETNDLVLG